MSTQSKTLIWAHRGASAYAPENTLSSFAMAAEMKADGIELDIQLTKDNEIVVVHDEELSRVSDGSGWVKDHTLAELRSMNFSKTHPEFKDEKIPTLEEVYELVKPTGMTVNVELKTGIFWYRGIEQIVLELTKKMGMEERVIYSSFNHYTLRHMKEMDPSIQTGLLYSDDWIGVAPYAAGVVHVDALHPALYHLQEEGYVETARKNGLETHVWTVDEPEHIRMCLDLGVEAIITDKPDLCRKIMEEAGR